MNSLVLRKIAIAREHNARPTNVPPPRERPLRLRGKGPLLCVMLALLVLAADFLLALLAWLAVDFVMR